LFKEKCVERSSVTARERGLQNCLHMPDRTVDERRAYKKLVEELKVKKIEEPDIKFFIIKIIK
jgi:hypothetical protein